MSYDDSIYGNSQVSPLLGSVLSTPGNVGPSPRTAPDADKEPCLKQDNTRNTSLTSSASMRSSISSLHFNGLANTQTQSDRIDALVRQGSLKENAHTVELSSDEFPGLKFTSASALHSSLQSRVPQGTVFSEQRMPDEWRHRSRQVSPGDDVSEDAVQHTFSSSATPSVSQNASDGSYDSLPTSLSHRPLVSISKPTPVTRPHSRAQIQRPDSPGSQDSFAGDLPRDIQQKVFIRESKTLNAPLSELVESQESTGDEKDESQPSAYRAGGNHTHYTQGESQASGAGTDEGSQPSAYRTTSMAPPHQQPRSGILYPSQQDDSQNMSGSDFSQSQAMSSSQLRFLYSGVERSSNDVSMDSGESTQESTSMQTTQTSDFDGDAEKPAASTPTTGPRSILSMVAAHKGWRYAAHGERPPVVPQPPLSPEIPVITEENGESDDDMSEPEMLETQPSAASNLEAIGQPIERQSPLESSFPRPVTHRLSPNLARAESSDMDIVPDSEATQPSEPTQPAYAMPTSSPEIPFPQAPPKSSNVTPQRAKVSTPRKPAVDEVVPDSYTEDDDDEEEEEEVPLAVVVGRSQDHKSIASDGVAATREVTPVTGHSKGKGRAQGRLPAPRKAKKEPEVVPSSYPHENGPSSSARKRTRATAGSSTGKKRKVTPPSSIVTPVRARSLRSSSSTVTRIRYCEDSEDEDKATVDGVPPSTISDDVDGRTDQGGENDMGFDEAPATRTRKRKRAASVTSKKGTRSSLKAKKGLSETPEPRAAKRRKSGSISPSLNAGPTRVFALWKQTNSFYCGTVHSLGQIAGRYNVHFDDDDQCDVDITKMRKCSLKKGDDVLLVKGNQQAVVSDVSRAITHDIVTVEVDDGEKHEFDIQLKELRIASRTINTGWEDRMLDEDDIVTMEGASGSTSSSVKNIFHKTAFVLTFPPGFHNFEAEKDSLTSSIKKQGGVVFEDWTHLFTLDGHLASNGKSWKISKEDVKLNVKQKDVKDIKRAFLLSNETCHKPRFLIALGLGIPCVNVQWLYDSIQANEEQEWHRYLLPAGTSERLSGRVSQLVDLDWGNSPHHLRDIMGNLVAAKPFLGKRILCLSPDFIPRKSNANDAQQMIPRIVLCMGAAHVDAAGDVKNVTQYDLVVLKDDEQRKHPALRDAKDKCVRVDWVKECLMTSRWLAP